jgi:hypothetical protein
MESSKRNMEEAAKKSKVVVMSQRDGGKDTEEAGKSKRTAARKPKSGDAKETKPKESEKTAEEELAEDDYKGAKKALRHAAKKVVKDNCHEIAGELGEKAKKGDLHSTEILLELMEKKKKKKGGGDDDDLDGPSLAEQLMAGPTWEEVLEARQKAREEEEAASAASS